LATLYIAWQVFPDSQEENGQAGVHAGLLGSGRHEHGASGFAIILLLIRMAKTYVSLYALSGKPSTTIRTLRSCLAPGEIFTWHNKILNNL
jgi:hypothetical protein